MACPNGQICTRMHPYQLCVHTHSVGSFRGAAIVAAKGVIVQVGDFSVVVRDESVLHDQICYSGCLSQYICDI
jgi:hypothetical protein